MMRILITGAKGFLGAALKEYLVKANYTVGPNIIDVSDWNEVKKIAGFDILIHTAAKTFVPDSFNSPREFLTQNITLTLNVLELCKERKAKLIFLSSYIYGQPEYYPVDESHPIRAHNPYAESKIIGEKICKMYYDYYGVDVCIVRPFNIYGPNQKEHYLIPKIIKQALTGEIELSDPLPKRDYLYIDDFTKAIEAILQSEFHYEIYNLGYGKSHSVEEITNIVCELMNKRISVKYKNESRQGEIMNTVACIEKMNKNTGWEPKIDIREGIGRILKENSKI